MIDIGKQSETITTFDICKKGSICHIPKKLQDLFKQTNKFLTDKQ